MIIIKRVFDDNGQMISNMSLAKLMEYNECHEHKEYLNLRGLE